MSITVSNVIVVKPKGLFTDDIIFDIEFTCTSRIPTYTNWQVVYVGSATDHDCDQILANVQVGPIEVGVNRFVLRADPPAIEKIPHEDLPLTAIMLSAFYKEKEFFRVGYYVSNTFPEESGDNPDPSTIERELLLQDTTVVQYTIDWN